MLRVLTKLSLCTLLIALSSHVFSATHFDIGRTSSRLVATSDDGKFVAYSREGKNIELIRTADLVQGIAKPIWVYRSKGGGITISGNRTLAISPNNKYIAAFNANSNEFILLDFTSGKELFKLPVKRRESIYHIEFGDNDSELWTNINNDINRVDIGNRSYQKLADNFANYDHPEFIVENQNVISISYGDKKTIEIRSASSLKAPRVLSQHGSDVVGISYSSANKQIASINKQGYLTVTTTDNDLVYKKQVFTAYGVNLSFSKDGGFIFVVGNDKHRSSKNSYMKIWSIRQDKYVDIYQFEPNGEFRVKDPHERFNVKRVVHWGQGFISIGTTYSFHRYYLQVHPRKVPQFDQDYKNKISERFSAAQKQGTDVAYVNFLNKFDNGINRAYPDRLELITTAVNAFNKIESNKINDLLRKNDWIGIQNYLKNHLKPSAVETVVLDRMLGHIKNDNTPARLLDYLKQPNISNKSRRDVVDLLYKQAYRSDNIAALKWFVSTFPDSQHVSKAVEQLHSLAYGMSEDEGTVRAYNDFIIAYPYAQQLKSATAAAYELDKDEHTSFFSSDASNSRGLLVRSKQIERKASEVSREETIGYTLIINRMNQLLQDEFPTEEATLRYLESEEFKDFYQDFRSASRRIETVLETISKNTAESNQLLRNNTQLIDQHFEKQAQPQALSEKYTAQHRLWQRYLKK